MFRNEKWTNNDGERDNFRYLSLYIVIFSGIFSLRKDVDVFKETCARLTTENGEVRIHTMRKVRDQTKMQLKM